MPYSFSLLAAVCRFSCGLPLGHSLCLSGLSFRSLSFFLRLMLLASLISAGLLFLLAHLAGLQVCKHLTSMALLELLSGTAGARIVAAAMTESRLQASVLVCVQLIQRTALIIRRIESL